MTETRTQRLAALLRDRGQTGKGRASRSIDVTLDVGLVEAVIVAEQALADLPEKATAKRRREAQAAMAAARSAADDATLRLTVTALCSDDFDDLVRRHPPRPSEPRDLAVDHDRSTFPDALLRASATRVTDLDGVPLDVSTDDVIDRLSNGERVVACRVSNGVNNFTESVALAARG